MHGQNSLLERDINKRESLAGKRRDSISDKGSKIFDPKKAKGLAAPFEQTLQVISMGFNICSWIFGHQTCATQVLKLDLSERINKK